MNYECQHRKEVVLGYFPVIMLSDLQASGASYSVYGVSGGRRGDRGPVQGTHLVRPDSDWSQMQDARPSLESEYQMLYSGSANEITRRRAQLWLEPFTETYSNYSL